MFLCKWMNLLGYKTRKMERFQSNLFSRYTSLFRNKSFGICFNLKFNNFCVSDGCSRWLQTWKWDEMEARTPWHVTRDSSISRVWVKWTLNCDESRRESLLVSEMELKPMLAAYLTTFCFQTQEFQVWFHFWRRKSRLKNSKLCSS